MINTIILAVLLTVNITWSVLWFYRKTQTLGYKVYRFVQTQRVKPRIGTDKMHLSEDAMIQIFLRSGNENFRDDLRQDYHREQFLKIIGEHLKKADDGMYVINSVARFITAKAPVAPPIEKDSDLIEL